MKVRALYRMVSSGMLLVLGLSIGNAQTASKAGAGSTAKKYKRKHRRVAAAAETAPVLQKKTGEFVPASATHAGLIHTATPASKSVTTKRVRRRGVVVNPWTEPTYADSTIGDSFEGEDLVVR